MGFANLLGTGAGKRRGPGLQARSLLPPTQLLPLASLAVRGLCVLSPLAAPNAQAYSKLLPMVVMTQGPASRWPSSSPL